MRHEIRNLAVPTINATAGAAKNVLDMRYAAVVLGTPLGAALGANWSLKIQGQMHASDFTMAEWIDLATLDEVAVAAGSVTPIPNGYTRVRIYVTTAHTGAIVACVSGKNARTDGG